MSNAARGVVPDLDSYAIQRHATIGVQMFMSWSEITAGEEIPGPELHDPTVRALVESASLINGWDNDILSYPKETIRDHDSTQNVVTVIARQYRCPTEQAITEAVATRNRVMGLFLRLVEMTRPGASSAMRTYIDDLGRMLRGNLDWSSTSPRYTSLTPRSELPTPGEPMAISFTSAPPDCDNAPPAIPSVAWWWDQLSR
jgi:Terpene synthase family 2, C-terminal metal binding